MDFTQTTYKSLLNAIIKIPAKFFTLRDYLLQNNSQSANRPASSKSHFDEDGSINQSLFIFRHDVDRLLQNSLKLAQLEHSLGIKGTYYFRVVPESYDLEIMHKNEELGYLYEDVDLVYSSRGQKSEVTGKMNCLIRR